jgi:hypothetical protein
MSFRQGDVGIQVQAGKDIIGKMAAELVYLP